MSASDWITSADADGVRTITFAREEKLNAFNNEMYLRFAHLIDDANTNDDVCVIVLNAKGKAFTVGQDLEEMSAINPEEERASEDIGFERVFESLEKLRKPIIAAVEGIGLGFGLTLLLHTDLNLISSSARFRLPFLELGVVPEAASSFLLPYRVGMATAMDWIYSGRWVSAEEIERAGLAHQVVEPGAATESALTVASRLAKMPPKATQQTRELLWSPIREQVRKARAGEASAFRERLGSRENVEALQSFFARQRKG